MDFEFSPEQEMLRDSVRGFLASHAPIAAVRAGYERDVFDPAVYEGLVELGVVGLGMVDSAVVLEELGRVVCPVPYASASVAAGWLAPDIPGIATLAIYEPGTRYAWDAPATRAARAGDGWTLSGEKVHVP